MTKFYTYFDRFNDKVWVRGYENGMRFEEQHKYEPFLFIPTQNETGYKTLDGKNVLPKYFNSMYEAQTKVREWSESANRTFYGSTNWDYNFIGQEYNDDVPYDVDVVKVATIDIETMSEDGFPSPELADQKIICISLRCEDITYVFAYEDYRASKSDVWFIRCKDEIDMLYKFLDTWEKLDIDIITGWNVEFFDMPFIINRIKRIMSETSANRLSPWKRLLHRTIRHSGQKVYTIPGISILDYMQLYKKFSYKMVESYRLDNIANVELGEAKLDYSEFDSLHLLYKHDFQKFVDYNIVDVELVQKLDDKLKMIEQVLAIAYDGKVNYLDTFTTVRMWDMIIHNYLLDQKIVVPPGNDEKKERQIIGAYVKDPQVGMSKWVVSFDLNSLYPHLIMQYNISPDTYLGNYEAYVPSIEEIAEGAEWRDDLKKELDKGDVNITAKGTIFGKQKRGFLPELMDKMYKDRVHYKNLMLEAKKEYEDKPSRDIEKRIAQMNNMQMAKKIQLNSAYGALSNEHFRFFANDLAESITMSGQLSIKWVEHRMNIYLNKILKTQGIDYVLACDTDSMYITLEKLVDQVFDDDSDTDKVIDFLDNVCEKKLEPFIDKCYAELAEHMYAYEQKMFMAREVIADKGIWVAKKRYILNVYDNEGVRFNEPQLKMMGIEAVRSSTPTSCRDNIKKSLNIIMNEDNKALNKFLVSFEGEFNNLPFEDIAFPRGVNKIADYSDNVTLYRKGTPIHVKGAIVYNNFLKEKGKEKLFATVNEGDKGKFCYMKLPNPLRVHVMTTPGTLPRDLDLEKYIDREKQFSKAFIEPLQGITDKIGWKIRLSDSQLTFEDILNGS